MYGDPAALSLLARRMRRLADELRAEADVVHRAAHGVRWEGESGDALRWAVRRSGRSLRSTAGLHDLAARSLERHADVVADRRALLDRARPLFGVLGFVS